MTDKDMIENIIGRMKCNGGNGERCNKRAKLFEVETGKEIKYAR